MLSYPRRVRNALKNLALPALRNEKRRGFAPPSWSCLCRSDYCSSLSTLCWLWLASASADTAIDWRVDSAWLLAASSLVSASVRLDEPVCSTLIRFLEKSWRICTIDRFEPKADASDRSEVEAVVRVANTLLVVLLSMKSVPDFRLDRPRPVEPNV